MTIKQNPDKEYAKKVIEKLRDNGGYCPCRLERTPDTKCICKEFREQKDGMCHCGLFVKVEDRIEGTILNELERINVLIKYHDDGLERIQEFDVGDMYDLRAAETVQMNQFDYKLIDLGISIKMPKGYTCLIVPRSSTFTKYRILQANSIGVIDNSYSGTFDVISFPAVAMGQTTINKNDRICQMCIIKTPPRLNFIEVDTLDEVCRGGYGSTGTN